MTEYRIRLEDIKGVIVHFERRKIEYVTLSTDDARWLVDTIDRLEKERDNLRQQVNQLADALAVVARIEEGE